MGQGESLLNEFVNPKGPVDRSVPVLRIDGTDGKPRAALFGTACHNTTLTQTNYLICGAYGGFAQAFLKERHPNTQAMLMPGCGGDANPYPRGTMEDARRHGRGLGEEVCLDRGIGPLQLWIAAYCNEYFGYLPSARVLQEGGYETRGLFSGRGWFAPAAQDVLVGKVPELANRSGRKKQS